MLTTMRKSRVILAPEEKEPPTTRSGPATSFVLDDDVRQREGDREKQTKDWVCIIPYRTIPRKNRPNKPSVKRLKNQIMRGSFLAVIAAVAVGTVKSELRHPSPNDYDSPPSREFVSGENPDGRRFVQSFTRPGESSEETSNVCQIIGARGRCNSKTVVSDANGTQTNLDISVECDLGSQIAFDFRMAQNCECAVTASNSERGELRSCGCAVCPSGFGDSAISVECNDDYITGECSSLDCGSTCNGNCVGDCQQSGPECQFCQDDDSAQTVAPTGNASTIDLQETCTNYEAGGTRSCDCSRSGDRGVLLSCLDTRLNCTSDTSTCVQVRFDTELIPHSDTTQVSTYTLTCIEVTANNKTQEFCVEVQPDTPGRYNETVQVCKYFS